MWNNSDVQKNLKLEIRIVCSEFFETSQMIINICQGQTQGKEGRFREVTTPLPPSAAMKLKIPYPKPSKHSNEVSS